MKLNLRVEINSDIAMDVLKESVKWIAPEDVYRWYKEWCKNNKAAIDILETENISTNKKVD